VCVCVYVYVCVFNDACAVLVGDTRACGCYGMRACVLDNAWLCILYHACLLSRVLVVDNVRACVIDTSVTRTHMSVHSSGSGKATSRTIPLS
jgi:hypothetical protein